MKFLFFCVLTMSSTVFSNPVETTHSEQNTDQRTLNANDLERIEQHLLGLQKDSLRKMRSGALADLAITIPATLWFAYDNLRHYRNNPEKNEVFKVFPHLCNFGKFQFANVISGIVSYALSVKAYRSMDQKDMQTAASMSKFLSVLNRFRGYLVYYHLTGGLPFYGMPERHKTDNSIEDIANPLEWKSSPLNPSNQFAAFKSSFFSRTGKLRLTNPQILSQHFLVFCTYYFGHQQYSSAAELEDLIEQVRTLKEEVQGTK